VPEAPSLPGRTVVLGERELAIGFRLIGFKDVVEVTPESSVAAFQKAVSDDRFSLVIASQAIRPRLSENQRAHADASLRPLVVFVPTPGAEAETESISALAKRVLGVTLGPAS
jgi:V/A-type H+/Na+-transporting ATPase subunit F